MAGGKVSIVICTYNRANSLERTLQSLKRLKYSNFEVIVVRGQCTDHTDEILEKYQHLIKVGRNDIVCLGRSRNIGIALSAGEYVAFLDDDAIPDPLWLDDLLELFTDSSVGGVGGIVYACNASFLEFGGEKVSVWGEQIRKDNPLYQAGNTKEQYDRPVGTNNLFRKSALLDVGGFDENYDWYFDECDLSIRLWKAGYKILLHDRAIVYHERGNNLVKQRGDDVTGFNWRLMVKSNIYYIMHNAQYDFTNEEIGARIEKYYNQTLNNCKQWLSEKRITREEYWTHVENIKKGYEEGVSMIKRKCNYFLRQAAAPAFKKFEANGLPECLGICLLCQFDPLATEGGIAKHTLEMAKGYVKNGHRVHIIHMGGHKESKMVDNIFLHQIPIHPTPEFLGFTQYGTANRVLGYSYGVYLEILRIAAIYGVDIVDTPIWDSEGLVPAYLLKGKIPVVAHLQTPLLPACDTQGWEVSQDMIVTAAMENALLYTVDALSFDSDALKETFREYYEYDGSGDPTIYIGIDPVDCGSTRSDDGETRFLFISRLERRKGVHTIFQALESILDNYPNASMDFVGNDDYVDRELGMSYKQYFSQTYRKHGWSSRVRFHGKVSNAVKEQLIADCDALLLPSLYESFGVPLVEAMSAGKPVIACDVGGMPEVVGEDCGFLIPVEDALALMEKMRWLIENPGAGKKVGRQGLRRYRERFSTEVMIRSYLDLYRSSIRNCIGER